MSEPFIGQIMPVGFNYAPVNWALCDGQLMGVSQNQALYALLGTTFGGDGRSTFGLPDLRGRVPVHVGAGPGLTPRSWGQRSGAETTTLNVANLAPHNHAASLANLKSSQPASNAPPSGNTPGDTLVPAQITGTDSRNAITVNGYNAEPNTTLAPGTVTGSIDIANNGSGTPFNNMQPWLALYFCIALSGLWPSRS